MAAWPADPALPLHGEARSRSCGSTLALDVGLDENGRIVALGCRAHACAVGQAAASVFLDQAVGQSDEQISRARADIADWLAGTGAMPAWPGLALLERAQAYPARHGAILLAWDAALAALAQRPALG